MIDSMQQHYGFTVMPFTAAIPVPALFGSAAHKEAVARLRWLISARGLGVITGEVGSGKTAAPRAAVDGLDPSRHTLIYLPNPQIGVRGIHGAVATALGQAPRFHHATLIPQVEAALAAEADERNRHVILAIDESHLLTSDQLEAVRMLTNQGPRFRVAADHPAHRPAHPAAPPPRRRHGRPGPARLPPLPHPRARAHRGRSQRVHPRATSSTPAGPTPCSPTTPSAPSTPTPAACPGPSTGSPSPRSWPHAPPARPSSTNPPPAPPSARKPPPRQTDHHRATPSTTNPARPPPGGAFTPAHGHAERRRHGHPERPITPAQPDQIPLHPEPPPGQPPPAPRPQAPQQPRPELRIDNRHNLTYRWHRRLRAQQTARPVRQRT